MSERSICKANTESFLHFTSMAKSSNDFCNVECGDRQKQAKPAGFQPLDLGSDEEVSRPCALRRRSDS